MIETFVAQNAGTVYRLHVAVIERPLRDSTFEDTFLMCETGWGSGYGEWIRLDTDEIAWNYLSEKMPGLARFGGDKPGWIMAFAKAGVRVFG